jgi:lipopolysaccharide biosynthesis protein
LEPDQKYGYGYLHVTREVVQQFGMSSLSALSSGPVTKTSDLAIVAHVHYEDVWPELNRHIQIAFPKGCDLFVTVTSAGSAAVVRRDFPKAYIILVENRGRDILPFLKMFKMIHSLGHTAICKVHTKKSPYRADGDTLRHGLLDKLLGSSGNVGRVAEMFKADESLGLLCPTEFLLPHTDRNMTFDHEVVSCVADLLKLSFKYSLFPAGSMFWFRPEALLKLTMLEDTLFPPESGWADGTPAHAVERIFGVVTQSSGFTLKSL